MENDIAIGMSLLMTKVMDRLTWYFGSSLCAYSYYATNLTALSYTGGVGAGSGGRGSFQLFLG